MSKISISSASITAPMGMVVGTATVKDIQGPSLSRIVYRRDVRSLRKISDFDPLEDFEKPRPSRKRRPKRQKRSIRLVKTSIASK